MKHFLRATGTFEYLKHHKALTCNKRGKKKPDRKKSKVRSRSSATFLKWFHASRLFFLFFFFFLVEARVVCGVSSKTVVQTYPRKERRVRVMRYRLQIRCYETAKRTSTRGKRSACLEKDRGVGCGKRCGCLVFGSSHSAAPEPAPQPAIFSFDFFSSQAAEASCEYLLKRGKVEKGRKRRIVVL